MTAELRKAQRQRIHELTQQAADIAGVPVVVLRAPANIEDLGLSPHKSGQLLQAALDLMSTEDLLLVAKSMALSEDPKLLETYLSTMTAEKRKTFMDWAQTHGLHDALINEEAITRPTRQQRHSAGRSSSGGWIS